MSRAPWWLEPGPERCPFCAAAFHIEAGVYCVDCDRPVCPLCVVTVRVSRGPRCPDCAQAPR